MKKTIFSLVIMSLLLMTTNSCSKSNPSSSGGICPFSKETFQGKTYKFTYKKVEINGIDKTKLVNDSSSGCEDNVRWRWSFGNELCTKYQITGPQYASCTTQVHSGPWTLGEKNGFKFIAFYWTPANFQMPAGGPDTLYFKKFDCNSFEDDFISTFSFVDAITLDSVNINIKGAIYLKI
jgi:hypothetical protein